MRRRGLPLRHALLRHLAVASLAFLIGSGSALAQSGEQHPADASGKPQASSGNPADAAKDNQRKTNDFSEAAQAINGPAGNPECLWFGRKVVRLMWVDDVDTVLRHLDLYDRFGCPGGHIQAAFRCLTRFGTEIDSKVPDSLDRHVHACWINPAAQPQAAAPPPPASPAATPAPAAPAAAPAPAIAAPAAAPAK